MQAMYRCSLWEEWHLELVRDRPSFCPTPQPLPSETNWSPGKGMSSTTVSSTWPQETTTASTPPLTGLSHIGATSQVRPGVGERCLCGH